MQYESGFVAFLAAIIDRDIDRINVADFMMVVDIVQDDLQLGHPPPI